MLKKFDRIYLIEDGKVKESREHKYLMELNGVYRKLYDIQKSYFRLRNF